MGAGGTVGRSRGSCDGLVSVGRRDSMFLAWNQLVGSLLVFWSENENDFTLII